MKEPGMTLGHQEQGSSSPSRILIVEDERITIMDINARLLELGYEVPATASTGEEAIARVAEVNPDLVLMDIVLQGPMDGIQAAEIIRNRFGIPVVFVTASSDDATFRRAKLTEPFGYLLKPFETRDLHTTIEMALYKRAMQRRLYQAQKMESMATLIGGISHDFNNILNNILGFVYQLRKYSHDPVKVAKYTDTIESSASRGAELAFQLLSFVREKKDGNESVNVGSLIDEVAALVGATFPKNITFATRVDGGLQAVPGNRAELYQAVLNLCLNARDAMPGGGRLVIEAGSTVVGDIPDAVIPITGPSGQQCITLRVSDTGCGIPRRIRERIFDPFFTTKGRGRGTGLGLSMVYNIVKNHNGTITVQSEESQGSSFTIYLPVVGQVQPYRPLEAPVNDAVGAKSILLVDDEAAMLELGKDLLEGEGYEVILANDGEQAVKLYREHWRDIALVVLDLVMPNLDGGQAYLEMKSVNPGVKAFFCTGYSSDEMITSLLAEEHLRALQKPFRPPDFLKTVREVIASSPGNKLLQ